MYTPSYLPSITYNLFCSTLRHIKFACCPQITDSVLKQLGACGCKLQTISLLKCISIGGMTGFYIFLLIVVLCEWGGWGCSGIYCNSATTVDMSLTQRYMSLEQKLLDHFVFKTSPSVLHCQIIDLLSIYFLKLFGFDKYGKSINFAQFDNCRICRW